MFYGWFAGKPNEESPLVIGELRTLPVDVSWYILGQSLGVSHKELDHIQRTEATLFKCKAEMFRTWIHGDPTATWAKVAIALEKIDENELATVIRNQYGTTADTASSSSGYSSVESSLLCNKVIEQVEMDGWKHAKANSVMDFLIKLIPLFPG